MFARMAVEDNDNIALSFATKRQANLTSHVTNNVTSLTVNTPMDRMEDIIEIPAVRITFIVLHIIAILLGALGNGSVIYFILRYRRVRVNATKYLVLNLAICDFFNTTIHQPMRLVDILFPFSAHGPVNITLAYCQVTVFLEHIFAAVAFHTLLAIGMERYLIICHPLRAKTLLTLKTSIIIIVCIWLLGVLFVLPLPLHFTQIAYVNLVDTQLAFCLADIWGEHNTAWRIYYLFLFLIYFLGPVLLIGVAYTYIFRTLYATHDEIVAHTETNGKVKVTSKVTQTRRTLAKVMLLVAIVFTVLHAPLFIFFLLLTFGYSVPSNPVFALMVIEFLPTLNAVFDPFIYCTHSRTFFRRRMVAFIGGSDMEDSSHKHQYHDKDSMKSSSTSALMASPHRLSSKHKCPYRSSQSPQHWIHSMDKHSSLHPAVRL